MKIVRITDGHLNFVHEEKQAWLLRHIKQEDPELIISCGDLSDGKPNEFLSMLSDQLWQDIYYVNGNHDFYGHSVKEIRDNAIDTEKIRYLTKRESIHLDEKTTIIGHDGWGDGRNGNVDSAFYPQIIPTAVRLRDFNEINDLKFVYNMNTRLLFIDKLKELGDEAAAHIKTNLQNTNEHVIVVTHVPPFNEACFYRRQDDGPVLPQDENWSPFFSCKATGDVLKEFAEQNPNKKILVLAGHTHEHADVKIKDNLRIIVGRGHYKVPKWDVIDTEEIFAAL